MKMLKKAVVVCATAAALALAVPGIASADPGTGRGGGNGDFANLLCTQFGYQYYFSNHGRCVSYYV